MKTCPFCGEPVGPKAKRCRTCEMELRDEFGEPLVDDDPPVKKASGGRRHQFMNVVGESHHQETLQSLRSTHGPLCQALLVPEPENTYDPNAVRVTIEDRHVGYLSREVAKQFGPLLRAQPSPMLLPAQLHGGEIDLPLLGVTLDFSLVYALKDEAKRRR